MRIRFLKLMLGLVSLLATPMLQAQGLTEPLPVDSAVRKGTLPNGLTYMIRHHEYPKGQADFYIAQKVGSMQENDDQRGLAHFLEHMCFNGTEHFPGNEIDNWLASKGVVNGRDQNAYTYFDETVYNISRVPVGGENTAVEDSCLMILRDWAGSLLLTDKEIDDERGVIEQEWRLRNTGMQRLNEQALPVLFPNGNLYGRRMPIGTMEVVLNFPYQAIRDYYHTWYHPDLQGIIVVGDVDVNHIEAKIKELFSDLSTPANAPERTFEQVPDHKGMLTFIGADPELTYAVINMDFATPATPREMRNTPAGMMKQYYMDLIVAMLDERFNDIASKPGAPFAAGGANYGDLMGFVKTKDGISIVAMGSNGEVMPMLEAAYRELLRAVRGGFTQSEIDRANAQMIANLEKLAANKSTITSTTFADQYVRHFLDNQPALDVADERDFVKMMSSMTPASEINKILPAMIGPDNRRLMVMIPEKEGVVVPTEEQVNELIAKVDGETIEAYKEELRTDPLIRKTPVDGKIIETEPLPDLGAEKWTLSNGVTVIVKPTTFADDQILMAALSRRGWANYDGLLPEDIRMMETVIDNPSAGDYSANDLTKYLAGKNVNYSFSYDDYGTSVSGATNKADLPTLMEVTYAILSDPNIDADLFAANTANIASVLETGKTNPNFVMNAGLLKSLYPDSRRHFPTAEDARTVSRDRLQAYVADAMSNAADFTYVFTGNFTPEELKPLVEKYIASLPSDPAKAMTSYQFQPALTEVAQSALTTEELAMETPQVMGQVTIYTQLPYNQRNTQLARMASEVLTERLNTKVREQMGATYGINGSVSVDFDDPNNASLQIPLMLKPEQAKEAIAAVDEVLAETAKGITAVELGKAREMLLKDLSTRSISNGSWMSGLLRTAISGQKNVPDEAAMESVRTITADEIATFLQQILQGTKVTYVLNPK